MNFFILKLVLIVLINSIFITVVSAGEIGKFEKAPCPFELPKSVIDGKDFIFGYVTVPEQHAHPEGPAIQIAVGIFPCRGENPAPDPLVLTPVIPVPR